MATRPSWMHFRSTPSHGYYSVDDAHFKRMRTEHPELLTPTMFYSGGNSFEEDCEVYRIILAFPQEFDAKLLAAATSWCINCQPEIYALYTAAPVRVEDSRLLQDRAFFAATRNKYVSVAGLGVENNMVKVWFVRGGRNPDTYKYASNDEVQLLVPHADYISPMVIEDTDVGTKYQRI